MSFLKNIIRRAIGNGIRRGVEDAVSHEVEKAVAPKAEAYANSVADSLYEKARSTENNLQNAAGLSDWNEKLAGFPVWCFGGKKFSIDKNFTSDEGTTYYVFRAVGATYKDMCAYINVLKADGFVQKYKDSDSVLYKDLGGEYLVFSSVEAFNDTDVMCVGMHRTKNENDM